MSGVLPPPPKGVSEWMLRSRVKCKSFVGYLICIKEFCRLKHSQIFCRDRILYWEVIVK